MENITYDARIWKTEIYRGTKVTTYTVRWKTGDRAWKQPFRVKAQAESFVAELRAATRKGEAFSLATGRPVTWSRAGQDISWYDFCISYVDMKWKNSAAHRRSNIAWTLVSVMHVMLVSDKGKPDAKAMRVALRKWGFNTARRDECPEDSAHILAWLSRNTRPVSALTDPALTRALLDAAATLLDGRTASAWTARGNRAVLDNAMEYAVELGLLGRNPVRNAKSKAPRTSSQVDRRSVVNHAQARRLLNAVRRQTPSGPRLVAFFGVLYYAALRPEEAVNLRDYNVILPPLIRNEEEDKWEAPADGWGELRLNSAAPEVGAEWTDDGARHEQRRLKSRAEGEWRHVPVTPQLAQLLRSHLEEFGIGPDGRVFSGARGRELASITYRRVWDHARAAALSPVEYQSPLAKRVYDLRHACVSTWLNGGVQPAQVAEWAGHSVAVLLRTYAKCIEGQDEAAKRRIRVALRDGEDQNDEDGD